MVKYSWYKYYYIIVIVSYQIKYASACFPESFMAAVLSIMLNKQVNMIIGNKKGTKNRSNQEVIYV